MRGKSNKSSKPGHKRKNAASDEESDDEATSCQSTKTQEKMDNEINPLNAHPEMKECRWCHVHTCVLTRSRGMGNY